MPSMGFNELMKKAKEAGSFELVPPGPYVVEVDDAEAKSASTGKDMIKMTYKILSGPHAGQKLFNNHVISPENANAVAFFFRHMKAYGLGSEFFEAEPSLDQVAKALVGRVVTVKVKHREWQGETRTEVDTVTPAPPEYGVQGAPSVPADPFRQAQAPTVPAAPAGDVGGGTAFPEPPF